METFAICFGIVVAPLMIGGWILLCKFANLKKPARYIGLAVICLPFGLAAISMGKFMFVDEPLLSAACDGHLARVRQLVSMGANVNIEGDAFTPLGCSLFNGEEEVALYLINHGADVNLKSDHETPLAIASERNLRRAIVALRTKGAK